MNKLTTGLISLALSLDAGATELLPHESKGYIKACFNAVTSDSLYLHPVAARTGQPLNKKEIEKPAYTSWRSQILKIDARGAVIKAKVRVTRVLEERQNNGWGETKRYKSHITYTCLTEGVAKNSYPKPQAFLMDKEDGTFEVASLVNRRESGKCESGKSENYYELIHKKRKSFESSPRSYRDYYGVRLANQYFDKHLKNLY